MYEVHFRQQSGNYRWSNWTMTAIYLGPGLQAYEVDFSQRPKAGTTSIDRRNIIRAVQVPITTEIQLPKRERKR